MKTKQTPNPFDKDEDLHKENNNSSAAFSQEENHIIPIIALRGIVVMPSMVINFDVARDKSIKAIEKAMSKNRMVFLTAQKDIMTEDPAENDLYTVGVIAEIRQVLKSQNDNQRVLVEGIKRAKLKNLTSNGDYLQGIVVDYPLNIVPKDNMLEKALIRSVKKAFEIYCFLSPKMPKEIILNVMNNKDPITLVEFAAGNLMLNVEQKQFILQQRDYMSRLNSLLEILQEENKILELERGIAEKVKNKIDDNQREYYLREQIKVISEELGEDEDIGEEAEKYRYEIYRLALPKESQDKLLKEVDKLYKLPQGSHESAVSRNYLDTCIELPWNKKTKDKLDLQKAQKKLDKDHYGMEKVKERILEFVAVKKLAPHIKGQIICLQGPPGVGKTSIAKSLASAIGKKYVRISLGGIKDESEIRGHRKTYIGSMPGRIIDAIKTSGVSNPLILLDEIDKMSNDFRGDPTSAMLEVLDSEQNSTFRDHYIELPFDLSEVMFVTTANDIDSVPAPLRDRMEIIELSSYTREEKFNISKKYLLPKQLRKHGLTSMTLKVKDDAIYEIIDSYTRESGVRQSERVLASLCRKAARRIAQDEMTAVTITKRNIESFLGPKKFKNLLIDTQDRIGVVTGLAWTCVGGETMNIECSALEGDGKIIITGNLGDVMKESAKIAVSYVRTIADKFGIEKDFYKKYDLHIHAPEGAVPKDGPSAGVTITTAIISELAKIPVRHDVAMTGEISLKGKTMAIGGLKEKTMAAYRLGIKTIIIPQDNISDLEEIDKVVKDNINFIPATNVCEVLKNALLPQNVQIKIASNFPTSNDVEHGNVDLVSPCRPEKTIDDQYSSLNG